MTSTLTWERVAHHAHLEVLPALGGLAILTGILGILGVHWALTGFVPLALLAVGLAVLVGSVASYMCLPAPVGRSEPVASPKPPVPSPTVPSPSESRIPRSRGHGPEEAVPHSGIGRATLAHLTRVEDELWHRWASPPAASLGARVVGPVASTAYSPHKPGAFVAFPERDRDAIEMSPAPGPKPVPKRLVPARPQGYPAPVRGDIALRQSTPGKAEQDSARIHRSFDAAWADEPPPFLSGRGGMLTLDAFDHPVDLESIHPILPRLRPTAPSRPERSTRSPREASGEATVRRFCGECSRRLSDFRSWVECRFCRKPLCRQCLQESFEGQEVGACMECRAERARSYGSAPARSRRPARGSVLELANNA